MYDCSIYMACDTCESEFEQEIEPTELVSSSRIPAWDAHWIVEAAEKQGWQVTAEDVTCPTCLTNEAEFDDTDYEAMEDDGDHRRDERAIYDHLKGNSHVCPEE